MNNILALVDNGHGRETQGKCSPEWDDMPQLKEWEFNRDIAKRVVKKLLMVNLNSRLVVPEIHDVALSERVRRVNKECSRSNTKVFGISIHANAFTGRPTIANGWEAWTSPGETQSDILAELLYLEAEKTLPFTFRKDLTDGDSDKESRFTIIQKTRCPFVLTENGFMDNYANCFFMQSIEGREAIAEAHFKAVIEFAKYYTSL